MSDWLPLHQFNQILAELVVGVLKPHCVTSLIVRVCLLVSQLPQLTLSKL